MNPYGVDASGMLCFEAFNLPEILWKCIFNNVLNNNEGKHKKYNSLDRWVCIWLDRLFSLADEGDNGILPIQGKRP